MLYSFTLLLALLQTVLLLQVNAKTPYLLFFIFSFQRRKLFFLFSQLEKLWRRWKSARDVDERRDALKEGCSGSEWCFEGTRGVDAQSRHPGPPKRQTTDASRSTPQPDDFLFRSTPPKGGKGKSEGVVTLNSEGGGGISCKICHYLQG